MPIDLANDSDQESGDTSEIEVLGENTTYGTNGTSQVRSRDTRATKRARLLNGVTEGRTGGSNADDVIVIDE